MRKVKKIFYLHFQSCNHPNPERTFVSVCRNAPVHKKLATVAHIPRCRCRVVTTNNIPPPFMSGQCTVAAIILLVMFWFIVMR